MAEVTVRDLRNNGKEVLDRVEAGETLTVTRHGRPVAELRPIRGRGINAKELIERMSKLPPVDPEKLRQDIDSIFDTRL